MSSFEKFRSNYEQAIYVVLNPQLNLHVGVFNPSLQVFLKEKNTQQWAMITAYNPGSTICTASKNRFMNGQLEQLLHKDRFRFHEAEHRDPKGLWPVENSFFIENIELERALALGRKFGQNGIVAGDQEAIPLLFDCTFRETTGD